MKNFQEAVEFVLQHEGGYVNDPRDPGGETKFGISKRAYPAEDIKNMTREHAIEIYKRDYWAVLPSSLPDSVRAILFDCAVNTGSSRAIRLLQKAVGVAEDGNWGPKSAEALAKLGEQETRLRFCAQRIVFYAGLPTFNVYGLGWTKRVLAGVM